MKKNLALHIHNVHETCRWGMVKVKNKLKKMECVASRTTTYCLASSK
jgi:hypothetical protein